ncbi:alpha/beta hydrolase [Aliidongia dinghuensis]|uniref:Alpha/beta hydrolase n=1 Tax=Aliidongia dinghuensis TaxID=1867774 RepID=A0A8J3E778_9PROT|nr:alpha/beta hydrolase [Aliidongia dinghuensis]GGF36033.1 alpha/beta hydrolase [Aliidongia dinghuensis]
MRRSDFIRGGALLGLVGAAGFGARAEEKKAAARPGPAEASGHVPTPTFYRTETVEGIPIFYREAGRPGSPVVMLLHGWPSSSRMYRDLIPLLADKYHVIAPDYPGFGQSGVPPRSTYDYSFDSTGQILDAFLQKLQIEKFALYASDIGGPIGYRLMLKKPGRMTALIAQNSPAYRSPNPYFKTLAQYWKDGSAESRQAARVYISPEAIKRLYVFGVKDEARIDPDNWLIDNCLMSRPGVDEINLDILHDIGGDGPVLLKAQDYFREHRPPTLVVTGANDEVFSGEYMKKYRDFLPDAEIHLLDTGHFALEDHASEIASLALDFLGRTIRND